MQIQTCGQLDSKDLIQLCDFMRENISALSLTPWSTAILGLLTGLAITWVTVLGNRRAQRTERRNTAQLSALIAVQDVALKLRNKWSEHLDHLQSGTTMPDPFPALAQASLQGEFSTAASRIDNTELRENYARWEKYAELFFNDSGTIQGFEEQQLWDRALVLSGKNIRWIDS
ncbi:hypothetical protein [Glutamicibacter sp. NPDC087344]|uniref:hypothetical protein n=1 Tax=Glutamicibacter sp. NPDC087344 TaxID=3363994 RepID=UPI0037FC7562